MSVVLLCLDGKLMVLNIDFFWERSDTVHVSFQESGMPFDGTPGRGVPLPERDRRPTYPLYWPKQGKAPLDLTCLAETWCAYWVHWVPYENDPTRGRDRLCTEEVGCSYHHFGLKWWGCLPIYHYGDQTKGILVVTPSMAHDLQDLHAPFAGLLGLRIYVARVGMTRNGTCRVKRSPEPPLVRPPSGLDMQPTLARIWGLREDPDRLVIPMDRSCIIPYPEPDEDGQPGPRAAEGGGA